MPVLDGELPELLRLEDRGEREAVLPRLAVEELAADGERAGPLLGPEPRLTLDRARVDLTVLSQSRDGFCVGDVTTSTMSPWRSTWRRGTILPLTRAPTQWLPTCVWTAYAKSIGVEPSGGPSRRPSA